MLGLPTSLVIVRSDYHKLESSCSSKDIRISVSLVCVAFPIAAILSLRSCCDRISCWEISETSSRQLCKLAYLFDRVLHHISSNQDRSLLSETLCSCNGLILYAWVPLWLDQKDSICRRQVEPEKQSTRTRDRELLGEWLPYPKAPTPLVIMSTGVDFARPKLSKIRCRRTRGHSPSMRSKGIPASSRWSARRSKECVQLVKIILG